ncbi:hypothetical protein CYY_005808 [Polysphondylium violaceum]|uniref:rRNA methyltransferase 1, mitochondrial n=1 Tax=Polysphondylium violaceum TaxID=133409 RepID=A0A8J4V6I5_9MYCE|nr:hypothetical protein CYY_005808 [Polysphondylium violaceum]
MNHIQKGYLSLHLGFQRCLNNTTTSGITGIHITKSYYSTGNRERFSFANKDKRSSSHYQQRDYNSSNKSNNYNNNNTSRYEQRDRKPSSRFEQKVALENNNNKNRYSVKAASISDNAEFPKDNNPNDEVNISGFRSVLAIFEHRPQDLRRLYLSNEFYQENKVELKPLVKHFSDNKIPYRIFYNEEVSQLEKIAGTVHHEGIAIAVKERQRVDAKAVVMKELEKSKQFHTPSPTHSFTSIAKSQNHKTKLNSHTTTGSGARPIVILLDNVENPQNIGAIVRSCVSFGVESVFFYNEYDMHKTGNLINPFSPQSYRASRGALEYADVVQLSHREDVFDMIKTFKDNRWEIVSTSSHQYSKSVNLYSDESNKLLGLGPLLLIFGSESKGVSKHWIKFSTRTLSVPGTGMVDCLNVSQAISVILGEAWRIQGKQIEPFDSEQIKQAKAIQRPTEITPKLLGINKEDIYKDEEEDLVDVETQQEDQEDQEIEYQDARQNKKKNFKKSSSTTNRKRVTKYHRD